MNTIPLSTYVNAICQYKIPGVHDVADTVYGKTFEGKTFVVLWIFSLTMKVFQYMFCTLVVLIHYTY